MELKIKEPASQVVMRKNLPARAGDTEPSRGQGRIPQARPRGRRARGPQLLSAEPWGPPAAEGLLR